MKQLSQIDIAVHNYINSIGVEYSVVYNGEIVNDGNTMDKFFATFTKNNISASFDFFRGVGHREIYKNRLKLAEYIRTFNELILQRVSYGTKDSYIVLVPASASILYSLLSDSEAGQCTFPEFCQDFGYNEDSRKALDTYLACQNTGKQLNTIFKRDEISHLQTLLEDY